MFPFLPLCASVYGGVQEEQFDINGRSFVPQLLGKEARPRAWVHVQNIDARCVRSRDWILTNQGALRPVVELGREAAPPIETPLTKAQLAIKAMLTEALREAAFAEP